MKGLEPPRKAHLDEVERLSLCLFVEIYPCIDELFNDTLFITFQVMSLTVLIEGRFSRRQSCQAVPAAETFWLFPFAEKLPGGFA